MKKKSVRPPLENDGIQLAFPSPNVVMASFPYISAGWEKWFLLVSDRHFDSADTDRQRQTAHLEKAKERDAHIIEVGDTFDAMQGKFDPRRNYDNLRPEYKSSDYLDLIVKDAARFLGPYANRFMVFGRGNHESSVLRNTNTDLISSLVHRLNSDHGGKIQAGGYGGWVKFMFKINGTQSRTYNLKYHHGAGGGGPVTRGVIQSNRQAVYLPDADIVVNGHCFDEKTEILTPEGWKSHNQLVIGSQVMTLNRDTGKLEFQRIQAVHRYYDYKKLIEYQGRSMDFCVTDEHGLWVGRRKGKLRKPEWDHEKAQDTFGGTVFMQVAGFEENAPIQLDDAKIRLLAWILTEGNIEGNSRTKKDGIPGVIRISQSDAPDGRLEALENDLIQSGVDFTRSKRVDDGKIHRNYDAYRYNIKNVLAEWGWIGEYIDSDKGVLPQLFKMSLSQRRMFIDVWLLADGSVDKKEGSTGFQLATNRKDHVDFLQSLLVRSGYRSTVSENNGIYYIHACEKVLYYTLERNWKSVDYSGLVWCVTVPNETLLVRRNNKCVVTMNTHDAWYVPIQRERISTQGVVYQDTQHHIRLSTYKDEYKDGHSGFHIERWGPPKPPGVAWLRFYHTTAEGQNRPVIRLEVTLDVE